MRYLVLLVGATLAWGQTTPPAADPVVLTVGTEKITKAQFEQIISTLPEQQQAAVKTPQGRRQVADQLAELEVLAQEARVEKLDQDPKVKTEIKLHGDQVLASSLFQKMAESLKPDDAELHAYYDEHKKDWDARIKSDALGIITEDFENQKVDYDTLYTGYREIPVPAAVIDRLYADKRIPVADPLLAKLDPKLFPNEYVLLKDQNEESHTGLARFVPAVNAVLPLSLARIKKGVYNISPRNVQQIMALDLLLDDEVQMVTLMGTAGTGKTLLALAAGMHKCFQDPAPKYERLLVARPIMPMGRDIGFLPGSKDEKLSAWMKPIFDNLEFLLIDKRVHSGESANIEARLQSYLDSGKLVLEALTYIRGRSIPHQFMIVDEAQNLTPHEIKTIASRVGEGTKLVLTGDAEQIDNPYLDANSNGLSYTIERLKTFDLVGHVTLARPERSGLASLVVKEL